MRYIEKIIEYFVSNINAYFPISHELCLTINLMSNSKITNYFITFLQTIDVTNSY